MKATQEKTILGKTLRRRIITAVNGMGRGERIRVTFKGTRAYTNGRDIVLPAIRDLAEIPYGTARALIGYAVHEVAHILFTDFESIIRAIEDGRMEPNALIKKFENCIEDYRIERRITAKFPGAVSDLTSLRIMIHPKLSKLSKAWMSDPRACGPLALTWTGSQLNGFVIPEIQPTLDAMPAPVRALIENWTDRMKNVASTDEAVELAIAFHNEAQAFADASRQSPGQAGDNSDADDDADKQADDNDQQTGNEPAGDDTQDDTDGKDPADQKPADEDDVQSGDDAEADKADGQSDGEAEANADADEDDSSSSDSGDADADADDQGDGPEAPASDADQSGDQGDDGDDEGNASQGDDSDTGDAGASSQGPKGPNDDISFGSPSSSPDKSGQSRPGSEGNPSSSIDMDDGLTDEFGDNGEPGDGPETSESDDGQPKSDGADSGEPGDDTDAAGQQPDGTDQSDDTSADGSPQSSGQSDPAASGQQQGGDEEGDDTDDDGDDPFKDILDENAAFDDFLDDLRDAIAANPLPEDAPEATDGEVDPTEVMNGVEQANAAAPDYTSSDDDSASDPQGEAGGEGASKHHYNDNRFIPVAESDNCQFANLMAGAAGVIATTARTIRRLLMSEEKRGVLRNRRAGQFDIRNISAIVRSTGNCYRQKWERPAPTTHLTVLTDFSGSMLAAPNGQSRLTLAMTGALAIEEATRNTSIKTALYGFTGYSPNVNLYAFKEGRQSQVVTRRKIGAYASQSFDCTPTGEAMAAVGELLDRIPDGRRILLVLTDGDADDMPLCADVVRVLESRGIEVVAIGINVQAVKQWCANSHVINDVAQLPEALLAVIDPRGRKKGSMRKAA